MPATMTNSRLDDVINLPYIVLQRYHAGFVMNALARDSEALNDLTAEGYLKLVRLDRTLPEELIGEDFRLRCLAILRKFYRRRYYMALGMSWRNKGQQMEVRQKSRPTTGPMTDKVLATVVREPVDPACDLMWEEVQEFLGGLGTAQKKVVEGMAAGRSKNEVARELGMSHAHLNVVLRDAANKMRKAGVL